MINVTRSSMPPYEEYCEFIKPIFESRHLTNMGKLHNEFKEKLKGYLGISNVSLFTNGHQALLIGLKALGLKGEVITTPFTFASTTHAIVSNGLTPVFCDIKEDDYTIDADKIESLITPKTSAIVAVHVYGNVCDIEKLEYISKKHNIKLIFDSAHVFGTKYKDKSIASYGDMSMFSFHATKVFNTIEGGCLTYKDESLYGKLNSLRNFGITSPETVDFEGTNAKMNEFQAAMGILNLKYLDGEIQKRKNVYNAYVERLSGIDGIKLCSENNDVTYNYAYFPVYFDKDKFSKSRDDVLKDLNKNDIFARKYFYPVTNEFSCYKGRFRGDTPIAKRVSENILTLPMYADLTIDEVNLICDIILKK